MSPALAPDAPLVSVETPASGVDEIQRMALVERRDPARHGVAVRYVDHLGLHLCVSLSAACGDRLETLGVAAALRPGAARPGVRLV